MLFESRLNSFLARISTAERKRSTAKRPVCTNLVKRLSRLDLPTPLSPMRTTLKRKSSGNNGQQMAAKSVWGMFRAGDVSVTAAATTVHRVFLILHSSAILRCARQPCG